LFCHILNLQWRTWTQAAPTKSRQHRKWKRSGWHKITIKDVGEYVKAEKGDEFGELNISGWQKVGQVLVYRDDLDYWHGVVKHFCFVSVCTPCNIDATGRGRIVRFSCSAASMQIAYGILIDGILQCFISLFWHQWGKQKFNAGLLFSPRQDAQEMGKNWLYEKDQLLVLCWHIQDYRFNTGHYLDTSGTDGRHERWSRKIQGNWYSSNSNLLCIKTVCANPFSFSGYIFKIHFFS